MTGLLNKLFVLSCLLIFTFSSTAQNLKRQGFLGIYPAPVSLDDVEKYQLQSPEGIRIQQLLPEGTAAQAGLETNDIILSINDQPIPDNAALFTSLGALRADDAVTFTVNRSGKEITRKGTMVGRPFVEMKGAVTHYDEVAFEGGYLRSIVHHPEGEGPFPTIYFLQGYPCGSNEFANPNGPFHKLIQQWIDFGYAVYRVEKPGVGDSQGTPNCLEINFETELSAFATAYAQLEQYDFVNQEQIFFYGHSLGGWIAPLLAQKFQPAGVMVYGTGVYAWEDYLTELYRTQYPMFGQDYAVVEDKVLKGKPLLHEYFQEKKHPKDIGQTPAEKAIFQELLSYNGDELCYNRHYTFWANMNDINVVEAWKNTEGKVLAMHGELDIAALDSDAVERIVKIVNHYHPGNATLKIFPKTDHSLFLMDSMEKGIELNTNGQLYQYGATHFNADYAPALH